MFVDTYHSFMMLRSHLVFTETLFIQTQLCFLTWGFAAGSSGIRWCFCHIGSVSAAASERQRWSLCLLGQGGGGSSDRGGVWENMRVTRGQRLDRGFIINYKKGTLWSFSNTCFSPPTCFYLVHEEAQPPACP